ncbi:hypothetical protein C0Q70_00818 [Pomacea canaliculata]|uniref:Uncharacterized protein n=1 Tax=Pomacea canaliculata TaxID=400727 RepID=A0A2T7PXU4_POMCA|nr:hypothetical protein C0Q70_00818 [Pomacea canaliculata]
MARQQARTSARQSCSSPKHPPCLHHPGLSTFPLRSHPTTRHIHPIKQHGTLTESEQQQFERPPLRASFYDVDAKRVRPEAFRSHGARRIVPCFYGDIEW